MKTTLTAKLIAVGAAAALALPLTASARHHRSGDVFAGAVIGVLAGATATPSTWRRPRPRRRRPCIITRRRPRRPCTTGSRARTIGSRRRRSTTTAAGRAGRVAGKAFGPRRPAR